jgi:4-diphosphocytidyl-2-C-methyl-D-erythritol kinase
MTGPEVRELAYAKLNLVLHVGKPRPDGLHPICSVFASLDLADEVLARPNDQAGDTVVCPPVRAPNLATAALAAFRERIHALPPLHVEIEKRIPVAAGLGGGSADAAATLRAANRIAGNPLGGAELREMATALGSDVPSQVEPRHALVTGVGETIRAVALPPLVAVLTPQRVGLSAADVYTELDRMRGWRERLDEAAVLAALTARSFENDLQPAALALRPELADVLEGLRAAGARAPLLSGSGPTCFGLFDDLAAAEAAASAIPGAIVARLRDG